MSKGKIISLPPKCKETYATPEGPTAYFDVDSTLIFWGKPDNIPDTCPTVEIEVNGRVNTFYYNEEQVMALKEFAARGHVIIVWSKAGGVKWSKAVVKALGLWGIVDACQSKASYYFDDIKDPSKWMGEHKYFGILPSNGRE